MHLRPERKKEQFELDADVWHEVREVDIQGKIMSIKYSTSLKKFHCYLLESF